MSGPTRVQQGIPTGGQFAATQRGEADVDLATESTSAPASETAGADSATSLEAAMETARADWNEANERFDAIALKTVAQRFRQQWPTATHVELVDNDQGGDGVDATSVRDADGTVLADADQIADFDDEHSGVLREAVTGLEARSLRDRPEVDDSSGDYELDLAATSALSIPPSRSDRIAAAKTRATQVVAELDAEERALNDILLSDKDETYQGDPDDPDDFIPSSRAYERYAEAKETMADSRAVKIVELAELIEGLG